MTAKSKRLTPVVNEAPKLERDDCLWFDDGTVILQAEKKIFRVYKNILAAKSPVFKDMFSSLPPTTEAQTVIEGCPVVCLLDTASDLKYFLRAMHATGIYQRVPRCHTLDKLAILSGILRLSTKYNVDYLRARAIARLVESYPTSILEWDKRDAPLPFMASAVLKLARELNVQQIVPAVLYDCCKQPIDAIFDGHKLNNGTHFALPLDDQRMCIKARDSFKSRHNHGIFSFLERIVEDRELECKSNSQCNDGRYLYGSSYVDISTPDPLAYVYNWGGFEKMVCAHCFKAAKAEFNFARNEFWEGLPHYFNLPDWKMLLRS